MSISFLTTDYLTIHIIYDNNLIKHLLATFPANLNQAPVFDLDWHDTSTKLIVGCGNRFVSLLDVEKGIVLKSERAHANSVRCVRSCQYNTSLFVSGGRDGKLILWD